MLLGIDFGTCFSSVAFMQGTQPKTHYFSKLESDGNAGVPTLYAYSRSKKKDCFGIECTGYAAAENGGRDIIKYMKRIVRENGGDLNKPVYSGGKSFTIGQIVEKYIGYLIFQAKVMAEKSGEFEPDERIEQIVITAPVGIDKGQGTATDYNDLLRRTVMNASGLPEEKVFVIKEPVAAAISYLYGKNIRQKYTTKQSVMVLDIGGGTTDVSVVEYNPANNSYDAVVKEGDLMLGGNEWDVALATLLIKKTGANVREFSDMERFDFTANVTAMKHKLSRSERTHISFECGGELYSAAISRQEFESATKPLMDRVVKVVKRALDSYPGSSGNISKIVLVGGSSNMPQVRNGIIASGYFSSDKVVQHDHPEKAIAEGAAIYTKFEKIDPNPTNGTGTGGMKETASCTYGIKTYDREKEIEIIYNILFKGNHLPLTAKSVTSFSALKDDQSIVSFYVYETQYSKKDCYDGNSVPFKKGLEPNGLSVTVNIPSQYAGRASDFHVWVKLSLDNSEILRIEVVDENDRILAYNTQKI